MKKLRITQLIALTAIWVALTSATAVGAALSDKDKQLLAGYEKAHAALATDDLNGAIAAADDLGSEGTELSKSTSLEDARVAFEKLSVKAKQLAAGQSGYHVAHCPMLNKDWVQTSTTISNPYGGKEMVGCGEIQK
jgi:hypothetical protein